MFVLQAASSLDIAASSSVVLANGAQACHVYWQVGSSATLGADASFAGSVLAHTSITVGADTTVRGRLLAGTGSVTLIDDTITRSDCATTGGSSSAPSSTAASSGPGTSSGTASSGPSTGSSATASSPGSGSPSGGGSGSSGTATGTAPTGAGALPVVGSIGPVSGPIAGGTTVTVAGSGFVPGATGVTVGGVPVPATDVHVLSSTRLTFVTPAHEAGSATVVVRTRSGTSRPGVTFVYGRVTTLASTGAPDTLLAVGISLLLLLGGALVLVVARRPQPIGRHR